MPVNGINLFNALPKSVREITDASVETFKRALDPYLKRIPEQPLLTDYTKHRVASSNSIIQLKNFQQKHVMMVTKTTTR